MRGNGSEVRGTLIVRGALHETYEDDGASGEWVTKTRSATFAIENRRFVGIPGLGDKVNIGPAEPPLDYWAEVDEVEELDDGTVRVTAQLDLDGQREEVEENEVSAEYEGLTFYGHARQIANEVIEETRTPLSDLED